MVHYNFDTEVAFEEFVNEFDDIKNKLLKEIEVEIARYSNLKESIISKNIDLLLNDDSLFNDAVKNSLKVIKYLTINNVTNVPQYTDAIEELNSYVEVVDNKIEMLNNKISRISILELYTIGIEDLILFLNNSNLSDNDRLNVLLNISYSNSNINSKDLNEKVVVDEILDIDDNELEVFDIIHDDISIAKDIISKYNYLIKDQSSRMKMIRKSQFFWIDALKENIDLVGIDNFTKFEILLYKLNDLIKTDNEDELKEVIELFNKIRNKVNL